jgi:nitrate reductase assembly molybdenum cofactor insertion protein NarJ
LYTEDEYEELYTKTFDVQPICYLDLGYVIFGEDYKRGAFLLHMQEEQQKVNNDCGTDLVG